MKKAVSMEKGLESCGDMASVGKWSFWEIDGYKEAIKRANNGNAQLTHLKKMLEERAQIEAKYADNLTKWANTWKKNIDTSPEEAQMKSAWLASANEAENIARIHNGVKDNLVKAKTVVSEWQHDNFRKSHRLRDIEKGFKNAQQQWAEYLKRVADRQKKYYSACKDENNIRMEREQKELSEQTEEQKRKWQSKENKAHNEKLRCQEKYNLAVNELHGDKDRYQREMHNQFGHAQDFERKRLDFMKAVMLEISKYLNVSIYPDYNPIYSNVNSTISSVSVDDDLKAFELRKGPALPFNYPTYQEWSVDLIAPRGGGTMLSSQKGVVDGAVALNVDKNIESGTGSYRSRTDNSPPKATAASSLYQVESSDVANEYYRKLKNLGKMRTFRIRDNFQVTSSNLPPPPVSSPLPQVSSETSVSVDKTSKQSNTKSGPGHFSTSSKPAAAAVVNGNNSSRVDHVPVAASKTGTLDITNPFKFNTIRSLHEDDDGDARGSKKGEYENPFSGDDSSDEEQGSDSGDGVGVSVPPAVSQPHLVTATSAAKVTSKSNQFNLHSGNHPHTAATSGSAEDANKGEDHVYSNTNLINATSSLSTNIPPPPEEPYPSSLNEEDAVSSTAEDDSSTAGAANIPGADYSDVENHDDEMDLNQLRSAPIPNPRSSTHVNINNNDNGKQSSRHHQQRMVESGEDSDEADGVGNRMMTSSVSRTTTVTVTNSAPIVNDNNQSQDPARLTGTTEMDRSKAQLYPGIPVRALYNYEADEMDEISLREGDELLKLSEADENGWSYGLLRKRYGLYPASYVEPL